MPLRAIAFLVVQAALLGFFGAAFFGAAGAAVALSVSIVANFWSFWEAGPALLRSLDAAEIVDDEALLTTVAVLSARANIPAPRVFEIDETQPNAFVVGATAHQACLLLTKGLRSRTFTRRELAAVIGHELGHIRHRDTLAAALSTTLLSTLVSFALVIGILGLALRRDGGIILIVLAIVAPLCSIILFLVASRSQEYAADRLSAKLTGDAGPLISALTKLDAAATRLRNQTILDFPAVAHLCIVNPIPRSWLGAMLTMHPPVHRRIARLETMRNPSIRL